MGVPLSFNSSHSGSMYCWLEREERWEFRVEKHRAEVWANDMDIEGTPCQCGLLWWQETWERTSRSFKFWRESRCSYLLWAVVPSSNRSCTIPLSHSEDRGCTHIYENCLVCLWKSTVPFYLSSKLLAQAFPTLGSTSHMASFDMREWFLHKQPQNIFEQCNSLTLQIHRAFVKSTIIWIAIARPTEWIVLCSWFNENAYCVFWCFKDERCFISQKDVELSHHIEDPLNFHFKLHTEKKYWLKYHIALYSLHF